MRTSPFVVENVMSMITSFVIFPSISRPPKLERTNIKTTSLQSQSENETHHGRRIQTLLRKITTKISYDIVNQLSEEEEVQDPHKGKIQDKGKGQASHQYAQDKEDHQGDK
jgi:hypothetical protein